jgi:hypothetical protein
MANPISQIINPIGSTQPVASGTISCVTNAGFTQKVTITVKDSDNEVVASGTFTGKGENNAPAHLPGGGTVLTYENAKLPITLNAEFFYDPNGSFTPNASNKVFPNIAYNDHGIEVITILSEDWIDHDFNDMILRSTTIAH